MSAWETQMTNKSVARFTVSCGILWIVRQSRIAHPYLPILFSRVELSCTKHSQSIVFVHRDNLVRQFVHACKKTPVFNKLHTISCIYTSPMFSCITIDALLPSGVWRCSKHLCCVDEFMLPWKVSWEKSNCNNFFSNSKGIFFIIWGL